MPTLEAFSSVGEAFVRWLLVTSASATLIAGVVLIVQTLVGRWLTPAGRQRLWWLVAMRLVLPMLPASAMSIWNLRSEIPLTMHPADLGAISPPAAPSVFVTAAKSPLNRPDALSK